MWRRGQAAAPAEKAEIRTQWEICLEAEDIERLLAGDLPHPGVRAALEIRLQAAQSAASKMIRMLNTRCADGRVRNLYRIYGAVTGRWSGEGFQPQNLKRPELLQTDEAIAEAIAMVLAATTPPSRSATATCWGWSGTCAAAC